jgi:type II secretory pathway component PulF
VLGFVLNVMRHGFVDMFNDLLEGKPLPGLTMFYMDYGQVIFWLPSLIVGIALLAAALAATLPTWRQRWRWRLPAFRDASLWQCASATHIMLQSGCTLNQALGLLRSLEVGTPAAAELGRWQQRLADGHAQFQSIADGSQVFPPLFIWIVSNAHEQLAEGFRQAGEIYRRRAVYRIEAFLYAVLPVSVIVMGLAIFLQVWLFVIAVFLPFISVQTLLG